MNTGDVDAVITWVDGNDPAHKAKLDAYLASIGAAGKARPADAAPTRFNDAGELDYCVTSLLRFAPWIRTIHIVTDAQTPAIVRRLAATSYAERVRVVDHKTIFAGYEKFLPTFNSSSILAALWRIPDLAERFIFLNDDFVLLRPVAREDFFRGEQVVLRGEWSRFSEKIPSKRVARFFRRAWYACTFREEKKRAGYLAAQQLSARLLGFDERYFKVTHNPHPMRVSAQRRYFEKHPGELEHALSFRLRDPSQFIIEALSAHIDIKEGAAVFDNRLRTLNLQPRKQSPARMRRKIAAADADEKTAFACIQSLDTGTPEEQRAIFAWLNKRIGSPAEAFATPSNCQRAIEAR